jgi:hypothetical protein
VLPGNRCLQNVEFFFLRQYVQPCLLKNPKYTFYTIKSSHITHFSTKKKYQTDRNNSVFILNNEEKNKQTKTKQSKN